MTVRARSASAIPCHLLSGGCGGCGFHRRPQVRAKLRTGDAENGLITKRRFYANISKAMKMEPDRLVA